jgi:aminopeptidase N
MRAFVEAMRAVLRDPALDAAFKELALTLPSETVIGEQLGDELDPQRVHAVRECMKLQLAQALQADWAGPGRRTSRRRLLRPTPQRGQRALANLALAHAGAGRDGARRRGLARSAPTSASRTPAT